MRFHLDKKVPEAFRQLLLDILAHSGHNIRKASGELGFDGAGNGADGGRDVVRPTSAPAPRPPWPKVVHASRVQKCSALSRETATDSPASRLPVSTHAKMPPVPE